MRRLLPPILLLTGCVDSSGGRLSADGSVFDAARPDASRDASASDAAADSGSDAGDAAVDGSSDSSVDATTDAALDAGTDAGVDASVPSYCTVNSTVVVTTVGSAQALTPAVATNSNQLVVAWVENRNSQTDLFTRLVPPSGAAGTELPITGDGFVESWPTMVPSDTSFIVAYVRGTGMDSEIATAYFEPIGASLGGANDITADIYYPDAYPLLTPTATGALLHFEQDLGSPEFVVEELSANGSPASATSQVSLTRTIAGPIAIDATSTDRRLYYRSATTTLDSIALSDLGLEAAPNPGATMISTPSTLTLGTRIRTTPAGASPRVVLATATSGTRDTAMVQRMSSTGALVGGALELTSTRSVQSPSVTAFGGYAVIAYRSGTSVAGEARIALLRTNGTFAADFPVISLASITGSLEIVTLGDGSRMDVVLDDVSGSSRVLRVLRLACTLP